MLNYMIDSQFNNLYSQVDLFMFLVCKLIVCIYIKKET